MRKNIYRKIIIASVSRISLIIIRIKGLVKNTNKSVHPGELEDFVIRILKIFDFLETELHV